VLGFYTRHNLGGECPSGYYCPALAICDQGDAVTGGGFEHHGTLGEQGITVVSGYPTQDYVWQVTLGNFSGEDIWFRAYARCADLPPRVIPAISIPCGFSQDGLLIGLQIMAKRFDEEAVFRAAHAYEQDTAWHAMRPPAGNK